MKYIINKLNVIHIFITKKRLILKKCSDIFFLFFNFCKCNLFCLFFFFFELSFFLNNFNFISLSLFLFILLLSSFPSKSSSISSSIFLSSSSLFSSLNVFFNSSNLFKYSSKFGELKLINLSKKKHSVECILQSKYIIKPKTNTKQNNAMINLLGKLFEYLFNSFVFSFPSNPLKKFELKNE